MSNSFLRYFSDAKIQKILLQLLIIANFIFNGCLFMAKFINTSPRVIQKFWLFEADVCTPLPPPNSVWSY